MANAWIIPPLPISAAVTATGTLQLGQPGYVLNDHAGVVCQLACNVSNTASLTFDLGADQSIDTVLVFGVDLLPATGTMTVDYATAAQGPFTGAKSTLAGAAYAGSERMTSGKGVSLWAAELPVTARYVRINYAAGAAGQSVQAARVVIGRRIVLSRNYSYGGNFGVRDLGSLDYSRRGVLLRNRGAKLRTAALTFSNVKRDELDAFTRPLLERIGNTEMIALISDPAADAQRQNRCYFGALVGDLGHSQRNAVGWEAKLNIASRF